jgi:hypothetical protein
MTARDAHNLHESSYHAQWLFGTAQGEVLWDFRDGVLTLVDDGGVRTPYDAAEVAASPVFMAIVDWYRAQAPRLEQAA